MRSVVLVAVTTLAGCGEPSPHPAVATVPTTDPSATVTVRSIFCAWGGVGIVPDPLPPGYETNFVAHVVEIDNPGAPIAGVTVSGASLRDPSGAVIASLQRLDHLVDLTHEPPPDPSWGSFAVSLNPTGTPFDGTLPTGTTRLRARYAIPSPGLASPSHCHLELGGLGAPVAVEGPIDGVWPTS